MVNTRLILERATEKKPRFGPRRGSGGAKRDDRRDDDSDSSFDVTIDYLDKELLIVTFVGAFSRRSSLISKDLMHDEALRHVERRIDAMLR